MGKYLKEYRIEVGAAVIIVLGVFLLVERIDIIPSVRELVLAVPGAVHDYIMNYITNFSPSDLLGWILIFAAIGAIGWQARRRYLKSPRFRSMTCPRCGRSLQRVRRTSLDRFLSHRLLPDARRFRCSNADCRWSGLRYHEPRLNHLLSAEDSPSVVDQSDQSA
jgi:hypothetical protein